MKPKEGTNVFTDFGGPSAFDPTPLERNLQTQNLASLVGKAVFDLINNPPKIHRIPQEACDMNPVIKIEDLRDTHLQTDLTLTIPMKGTPLEELIQKTGLENLEEILARLTNIAKEEGMQIIIAYDDGEGLENAAEMASDRSFAPALESVIVNLYRTTNLAHYPRMKEQNEDFLNLFEWDLF